MLKLGKAKLFTATLLLGVSAFSFKAYAIDTIAKQAVLIDAKSGQELFAKEAHVMMPPASMSKLMTVYMIFERLKDGRLSLDDEFIVSETAWSKGGAKTESSTMYLPVHSRVKVSDLIRGIVIQSGNDACIVAAENISGSEENFANDMNIKAKELGLNEAHFANSTGWPNEEHKISPYDLALLASRLAEDFPEYYPVFAEKEFKYNNITQHNRNPLIYRMPDADGLKTGHTQDSGFGLTASAKRGDRRLVVVVNGLSSNKERGDEAEKLLNWGFREFDNYHFFSAGETVSNAEVWIGKDDTVPMIVGKDIDLTMKKLDRPKAKVSVIYDTPIKAPIKKGQKIGTLKIDTGEEIKTYDLTAGKDVAKKGIFGKISAVIKGYLL